MSAVSSLLWSSLFICATTHRYKEKGQTIVQHCLLDFFQYLAGEGRWAPAAADGSHEYWDDARVTDAEKEERSYYEGRGAAAAGAKFKRVFATSDGAGCQFLCAAFLFFVSRVGHLVGGAALGFVLVWCYFASAHGKSDCDPEGGAMKHNADTHVNRSSHGQDNSLRTTTEFGLFLRKHECTRKGNIFGVLRRWVHIVRLRGRGSPNRHLVRKVEPELRRDDHPGGGVGAKVKIRSIRRIYANGFDGAVHVSESPCFECVACVDRQFKSCVRSRRSKMFPIQLRPVSAVDPTALQRHVRADFEKIAHEGAAEGTPLAIETFDDDHTFFLVKPLNKKLTAYRGKAGKVYNFFGVDFKIQPGDLLLECQRFMPRSERTQWSFVLEKQATRMRVPAYLCRMKVKLVEKRARHHVHGSGGGSGTRFDVKPADKLLIMESCRLDDPAA
jgi:hypothetical protein